MHVGLKTFDFNDPTQGEQSPRKTELSEDQVTFEFFVLEGNVIKGI